MKKAFLLTILLLSVLISAVSADDIWEPAPEILDVYTIPDLFYWGESLQKVRFFLRDYEFLGMDVEQNEDERMKSIILSGSNFSEDFIYSFFFTKDSEELRQIHTVTSYTDAKRAASELKSIRDHYGMDSMEPYPDPEAKMNTKENYREYLITADAETIYFSGNSLPDGSEPDVKLTFGFADRKYYNSQSVEPDF